MLKATKNLRGVKPRGGFTGYSIAYEKQGKSITYTFKDQYIDLYDLVRHVRKFESVNDLPASCEGNDFILQDTLEDFFCRKCAYYGQFCVEDNVKPVTTIDKVRRFKNGGLAIARMKAETLLGNKLKVVSDDVVDRRIGMCSGCSLNRGTLSTVGHEGAYAGDIEASYGKPIKECERENHEKVGLCQGCGCKVTSKVFLDVEHFGDALINNVHDINRLLHARPGGGEGVCWQLRNLLHEQHLKEILEKGSVNKKYLQDRGYIK